MNTIFDATAIAQLKEQLTARGETIAVAESVTAGFLQAALASAEEATKFFQGGITAYNIGQKCRHLSVNPIHAMDCNCVSEQMAVDMAVSVCERFTSQWGVGITGYATPVPESGNQCFAWFAIAFRGAVKAVRQVQAPAHGEEAQLFYVQEVIRELLQQGR